MAKEYGPQGIERVLLQTRISKRLDKRIRLLATVRRESLAMLIDGLLAESVTRMEAGCSDATRAAMRALEAADE